MHRQVLSGKRSGPSSAEMTPRFSPQLTTLPQESAQEHAQPIQPVEDLAARLALQPAAQTPAAQLFAQPAVHVDAMSPEKNGLDLTFLDEEESPGAKTIPEMSPMSALFLPRAQPLAPMDLKPPVPRFL